MQLMNLLTMLLASYSVANPVSNAAAASIALSEPDIAASADSPGAVPIKRTIEIRQESCTVTGAGGLNVYFTSLLLLFALLSLRVLFRLKTSPIMSQ